VVNWEEIFLNHLAETRRLEKEKEDLMDKAETKEKSWELLKECKKFLDEMKRAGNMTQISQD
jgi:hypothetical protein